MNLLLHWGNAIWGIEAFSNVFLGIFALIIIIQGLAAIKSGGDADLFIEPAINILLIIVFWFLGFPIKGIIITVLIVHTIYCILFGKDLFSDDKEALKPFILHILFLIGDIIGMVLFFKNVL